MTISLRESGMPMTVSNELALHEHPALDLETQPDENAVALSRSAMVMPT
jgi:hypothetical protein